MRHAINDNIVGFISGILHDKIFHLIYDSDWDSMVSYLVLLYVIQYAWCLLCIVVGVFGCRVDCIIIQSSECSRAEFRIP